MYLNAENIIAVPGPVRMLDLMFIAALHEMCVCAIHQICFSRRAENGELTRKQHVFEMVRVREEEIQDDHGLDFGSRIHIIDQRARELLGLAAIGNWQSFARHHG